MMVQFFNPGIMYLILLPLCAAAMLAGAWLLLRIDSRTLPAAEKFPRARIAGTILGFVDLLWCIPNAMPILPESLHRYLLPLAILLTILAYVALDHLLSRTIGGFMILTAHFYLKESFANPTAGSVIFAVACFLFGTIGIFISGKPHLTREIIRLSVGKYRYVFPAFMIFFAVCSLMTFVLRLAAGGKTV